MARINAGIVDCEDSKGLTEVGAPMACKITIRMMIKLCKE